MAQSSIITLSTSASHTMNKYNTNLLTLIAGEGVVGDAHCGQKVKHRSRVAKNPYQPNLRQVHLIHAELFEELSEKGFDIKAGQMGENISTKDIDLLALSTDTVLLLGTEVKLQITGLRNPCYQLDGIQKGLMKAVLDKTEKGQLIRKAGVMAIVLAGGEIKVGDAIRIIYVPEVHVPLEPV